jgi:PAS domain S-box-containing protein
VKPTRAHTPQPNGRRRIAELEARLAEAEETLRAIRNGEVDGIVVAAPGGEAIFTLEGADRPYRRLVETMSEGAITLGSDGTVLYANARFGEMLGLPLERVTGGPVRDHVDVEELPTFDALFRSAWRGTTKGEVGFRKANGELVRVYLSMSALAEKDPVLCVLAADLTDQIRALEVLEAERLARSVLEQAAEAIVVCDRDGRIIRASRSTHELSGSNPLFQPFSAAFRLDVDPGPGSRAGVIEAAVQGEILRGVHGRLSRVDGTTVDVLVSAGPLTDPEANVIGCIVTMTDISVQKRAEEALRESDRHKDDFLAMLSHELRNPLAPIQNSIYLLARAAPGSEQARRACEVMQRQTHHLTRLVDDLLDLTRISRGKIELKRETVDAREVVRRTCEDHRAAYDQRRIRLELELPEAPAFIDADPTRISQVVGNLLQNAAKFSGEGGAVGVSIATAGERVEIRIRDEGVGIPAELLGRIFEPFVQADSGLARTKGGLGLGLALVKGLVELHGGAVRAQSAGVGRGSEVVVTLPLTIPAEKDSDGSPAAAAPRRSMKVLVIEDNVDAAQSIAEVLEMEGHRPQVATDGRSGVARAREQRPDVILCDIGLPDLDGYEIARTIRADRALCSTRLIALSGYAQPEDKRRASEAGFDLHLSKPPSLEDLISSLAPKDGEGLTRAGRGG